MNVKPAYPKTVHDALETLKTMSRNMQLQAPSFFARCFSAAAAFCE